MCAGLPMNVISIILALQTFCAVLFSVCPMHVCLFVRASYTVYAVLFLYSVCILSVYYHLYLYSVCTLSYMCSLRLYRKCVVTTGLHVSTSMDQSTTPLRRESTLRHHLNKDFIHHF